MVPQHLYLKIPSSMFHKIIIQMLLNARFICDGIISNLFSYKYLHIISIYIYMNTISGTHQTRICEIWNRLYLLWIILCLWTCDYPIIYDSVFGIYNNYDNMFYCIIQCSGGIRHKGYLWRYYRYNIHNIILVHCMHIAHALAQIILLSTSIVQHNIIRDVSEGSIILHILAWNNV